MKFSRALLLACSLLVVCGFTSQPVDERKAQNALPHSDDKLWDIFALCKVHYNEKKFTYSIDLTPEVKAMAGKPFTASGFMLPLEPKEKFTHYLLSKRTPTCPFCPPGAPNEIVEVFSKTPVKWDDGLIVVTGNFALTSNPEMGLFFQMKDAQNVDISTPKQPKAPE